MSTDNATYLWIIEWDDQLVTPQRAEVRHLTRLPGATDKDLERELVQVEIPAKEQELTRAGHVTRQLLLKLTGPREHAVAYASSEEGVAHQVDGVAIAVDRNAEVVWSTPTAGGAPG